MYQYTLYSAIATGDFKRARLNPESSLTNNKDHFHPKNLVIVKRSCLAYKTAPCAEREGDLWTRSTATQSASARASERVLCGSAPSRSLPSPLPPCPPSQDRRRS